MLQLSGHIESEVISSSCIIIHSDTKFNENSNCRIIGKNIFIHQEIVSDLLNVKNIKFNGNIYSVTDEQINDIKIYKDKDIDQYIFLNKLQKSSNEITIKR